MAGRMEMFVPMTFSWDLEIKAYYVDCKSMSLCLSVASDLANYKTDMVH